MENKLLIEFVLRESVFRRGFNVIVKRKSRPIQGKPFKFSLKITNIGYTIFPGAIIKNIKIKPAQVGMGYTSHSLSSEFNISSLNPNQAQEIYIAEITTLLEGLIWIDCVLIPKEADQRVLSYQRDHGTNQIIDPQTNQWGQEIFVLSSSQVSSGRLNWLVALLALLTFWEATLDIKDTILTSANFIGKILIFLGSHLGGK